MTRLIALLSVVSMLVMLSGLVGHRGAVTLRIGDAPPAGPPTAPLYYHRSSALSPAAPPLGPAHLAADRVKPISGLVSRGGRMLLQLSRTMDVPEEELLRTMGQWIVYWS